MANPAVQRLSSLQQAAAETPSVQRLQALQRLADGNTAMQRLAVIQRDVNTAAQALFDAGKTGVFVKDFTPDFNQTHGVTKSDQAAIKKQLQELIKKAPPKKEVAPKKLTATEKKEAKLADNPMNDQANWRTGQIGMTDDEGAGVAHNKGWIDDDTKYTCDDDSHTPNGAVFTDGKNFYGPDNTGHVGWGFKVWIKGNKKNQLMYQGNTYWTGTEWKHDARGTKEKSKIKGKG